MAKRDKAGHFVKDVKQTVAPQPRSVGGQFVPRKVSTKRRAMESELALLARRHGGIITAEQVVEQAEKPTSALHEFFDWDDSAAAQKWRMTQARQLITAIRITTEDRKIEVRALTSLDVDRRKGGGYRFLEDVMAVPALRDHLLHTALRELQSVESRYRHLTELDHIWGAIEEAGEQAPEDGKAPDGGEQDPQEPTQSNR